MGSKVALILSLLFVITFFIFSSDLINVQYAYSKLDAMSNNVNYIISKNYGDETPVESYVRKADPNADITFISKTAAVGEPFFYELKTLVKTVVMNEGNPMEVRIKRSVIIGYYN